MSPAEKQWQRTMPDRTETHYGPPGWAQRCKSFCLSLFVGLLVCLLFFAALEFLLRTMGWPARDATNDPLVGYSGTMPLYEVHDGVATTAEHKIRLFNDVSFKAKKPEGTYRIFSFGGSTTYGSPYDGKASFSRWLEDLLKVSVPGKDFEVINAGGLSYASYRIVHLVREALLYQPDLCVIYTGHNEFLERRTYSNLFAQGPFLISVRSALEKLGIYHALKAILTPVLGTLGKGPRIGTEAAPQETGDNQSIPADSQEGTDGAHLPSEVATILEEGVIGPEVYVRDDAFSDQVIRHFAFNLEKMITLCQEAGVPVILVEPASKLNDCPPFKSQHGPGLEHDQKQILNKQRDTVAVLLKEKRFSEALSVIEANIQADPLFAEYHYFKGKALLGLGRNSEALHAFVKARDLDVCPLRCITPLENQIRAVGISSGVFLVPFRDYVLQNARETGDRNGVPGNESFLDHVHPTLELHQRLAELILKGMIDHGLIVPSHALTEHDHATIYRNGEAAFDRNYLAMKDLRLGRLLMWAGQNAEARAPLERAAGAIEDPWTVALLARLLFTVGCKETAAREYERASRLSGGDPYLQLDLANAYLETGSRDKAIQACKALLAGKSPIPEARAFLGMMYIEDGMSQEALKLADAGLKTAPGHPSLLAAKSLALATSGMISDAIPLMETAVERDMNNSVNLVQLARICTRQGKSDEAIRCLAMAVNKGHVSVRMFVDDPTFEGLRNMSQFKKIVGEVKQE